MKKILVIDDEKDFTDALQFLLKKNRYKVEIANNANEGVVLAMSTKPDLILMDLILPKIDGADAVREIQRIPSLEKVPIILLSGLILNKEVAEEQNIVNINGCDYQAVAKPFENGYLLKVIKENLQ